MRIPIAEHQIVGALAPLEGKAPFSRADVVVVRRGQPDSHVRVRAFIGTDSIEGQPITNDDWRTLVDSEQALDLEPPTDIALGAAVWIFRRGFAAREAALADLRASGALLRDALRTKDDTWLCVVREPEATRLREAWSDRAFDKARAWARDSHWEQALDEANLAFVLEQAMSPERVALLALIYDRCGRNVRAEGYLEMARRSKGEAFAAHVTKKRLDLEKELAQPKPPLATTSAPRNRADFRKKSRKLTEEGLQNLATEGRAA